MTSPVDVPVAPVAAPAVPTAAPERMDHHVRMKVRAAAFRATRVYPGAVGELLSRELLGWEEMGIRLGSKSLIMRAVDEIMKAELPLPATV
jgi:hypothetical protein